MKLSALGSRDRRALTIGGAILIPSLLFIGVVKPYLGALSTIREQTEDERAMLVREKTLAARLPMLPEEKLAASQKLRQEAARLFTGEDELVATGNLAEYIASVADANGITLQQSETQNGVNVTAGVRAILVEVRAEGDVYGVMHFLHQLETGNKLVRIGRLAITPSRSVNPNPNEPNTADALTLTASVYGNRLDGVPFGAPDDVPNGAPSPFERLAIDLPSIDATIDRNPFDALRQAPNSGRYASGGVKTPEQVLRLVGTVISEGGRSFAVCFTGARTSQLVHIGEKVLGYTLQSVSRQRAVFTTPSGGQLVLETPPPGMYASSGMPGGRGRSGAPQNGAANPGAQQQQQQQQHQQGGQNQRGNNRGDVQRIPLPANGFNQQMDSATARALRQRIMNAARDGQPISVVTDSTGNSISIGGVRQPAGESNQNGGGRRRTRGGNEQ